MANRRMFSKRVTDSDDFLSLSLNAQMLYIHLGMSADDDGMINSITIQMLKAKATQEHLNELIEKGLIIKFESGVVAITHWHTNNYVARRTATEFIEEFEQLELNKNKVYVFSNTNAQHLHNTCITNVEHLHNTCITNTYTDKDRIDKDRLGKDRIGKEREGEDRVNCQEVVDLFHQLSPSYPKVKVLSDSRKKAIKARLNMYSLDDFKVLFEKAESSAFLKGANDRNWSADFDWLIKDGNMAKVIEGKYDEYRKATPRNDLADELEASYQMIREWAMEGEEGK